MKFYCDACHTKYAIADEKVRGKVLKIRCKKCSEIITVREAVAPVAAEPQPVTKPTIASPMSFEPHDFEVPKSDWYYALNGQTFGPYTLEGLRRKYATAELSDATYVWHQRLGNWTPVAQQPAFADALAMGHEIVPRRKTIGFTGGLEAIKAEDGPNRQRSGAVPGVAQPARPTPKPTASQPKPRPVRPSPKSKPVRTQHPPPARPERTPPPDKPVSRDIDPTDTGVKLSAPTPEARPIKDARSDKLSALRKKLRSHHGTKLPGRPTPPDQRSAEPNAGPAVRDLPAPTPGAPDHDVPTPQPEAAHREAALDQAVPKSKPSPPDPEPKPDDDDINALADLPRPLSGEAKLTFASGLLDDGDVAAPPPRPSAASARSGPAPTPRRSETTSTSDILARAVAPADAPPAGTESALSDSGAIPFLAEELPGLGQESSVAASTSESLLLDVRRLNRARQRRTVSMVAVAGLIVAGVAGVAVKMAMDNASDEPVTETAQFGELEDRPPAEIRRYSKEEQAKFQTLELDDELLFDEDEVDSEGAADAPEPDDLKPPADKGTEDEALAAKGPARPDDKPSIGKRRATPALKRMKKRKNEDQPAASNADDAKAPEADAKPDPIAALLAQRAGRTTKIRAPEDKLLTQAANKTLSKDAARRGFQRVNRSIGDCRERHNRHNAKLTAGKLKVSVTVEPTGSVSSFSLQPPSVQNTEFHNCMKSHRTRWRFAEFAGEPVVINTSVIIQ